MEVGHIGSQRLNRLERKEVGRKGRWRLGKGDFEYLERRSRMFLEKEPVEKVMKCFGWTECLDIFLAKGFHSAPLQ